MPATAETKSKTSHWREQHFARVIVGQLLPHIRSDCQQVAGDQHLGRPMVSTSDWVNVIQDRLQISATIPETSRHAFVSRVSECMCMFC